MGEMSATGEEHVRAIAGKFFTPVGIYMTADGGEWLLRRMERKEGEIRVRVTVKEKEAWTTKARSDGRDLSGWLRFLANREAGVTA